MVRAGLAALFLSALIFLAGLFTGHYVWGAPPNYVVEKTRTHEIVYRVQPSPKAKRAKRKPLPEVVCASLTEIEDPELLAEFARRFNRPDVLPVPGSTHVSVLTDGMIPRSRWGGDILVTATEGEATPQVDFVQRPAPRFAFRSDWSARAGPAFVGDDSGVHGGGVIVLDWRIAQTRRIDHGFTACGLVSSNPTVAVGYTLGLGNH